MGVTIDDFRRGNVGELTPPELSTIDPGIAARDSVIMGGNVDGIPELWRVEAKRSRSFVVREYALTATRRWARCGATSPENRLLAPGPRAAG